MTYTITTYGCREYLCRIGLIPGKLTFERVCIPVATIQERVSSHFKIPLREMKSKRRAREVARPRQVAMYLSRQLTSQSLPEIGRRFGGRDHTTVLHGVRQIEKLRATDADLNAAVTALQTSLEAA
jgi:chromosomal replication initiator protein